MFCSHSDRRSFRNQFWGAVFLRQSVFKAFWRESWLLGATLTSEGESLRVDIKPVPWGPWRSGVLLQRSPCKERGWEASRPGNTLLVTSRLQESPAWGRRPRPRHAWSLSFLQQGHKEGPHMATCTFSWGPIPCSKAAAVAPLWLSLLWYLLTYLFYLLNYHTVAWPFFSWCTVHEF